MLGDSVAFCSVPFSIFIMMEVDEWNVFRLFSTSFYFVHDLEVDLAIH